MPDDEDSWILEAVHGGITERIAASNLAVDGMYPSIYESRQALTYRIDCGLSRYGPKRDASHYD